MRNYFTVQETRKEDFEIQGEETQHVVVEVEGCIVRVVLNLPEGGCVLRRDIYLGWEGL